MSDHHIIEIMNKMQVNLALITEKINTVAETKDVFLTTAEVSNYTKFDAKTIIKYKDEIGYIQRARKIIFSKKNVDKWMGRYQIGVKG